MRLSRDFFIFPLYFTYFLKKSVIFVDKRIIEWYNLVSYDPKDFF